MSSPKVWFPPPVVLLVAWFAAWMMDRWRRFPIDGAGTSTAQIALSVVFLGGGAALVIWALTTLARHRTTMLPWRGASRLVTTGPFQISRNPAYVGLTFAYLGVAGLANMAWPVVTLPAALIFLGAIVISPEEQHLRAIFGDAYDAYCGRTHRWL